MKKIIGIAMCIVMLAGAAQLSAQDKNKGKDKQKTEQKSDKQKPEQKDGQKKPEQKPGQQRPDRQQPSNEDWAKQRADRMKEQLSLTDDQYAKVLELNKANNNNMPSREQMQNMTDEQRDARREEMRKSREEYNAKLKGILTPEQYSKYEENMKNMPRGGQPGQRPQGGPGGDRPQGSN